jgi:hypothetical protein
MVGIPGGALTYETLQSGVVVCLERVASCMPAAPIEPAPFGAENMDQHVPHRALASSDRLRELLRRQLRHHSEDPSVGPIAVVVKPFKIFHGHGKLHGEARSRVQTAPSCRGASLRMCRGAGGAAPPSSGHLAPSVPI